MKKRRLLFIVMASILMTYRSSEVRAEKMDDAYKILEAKREKYKKLDEKRREAEREAQKLMEKKKAEEKVEISVELEEEKKDNSSHRKNTDSAYEIMEKMREKHRRREEERIEAERREAERKLEEQKAEERRQKEEAERLAQEERERYKKLPYSQKLKIKVDKAMEEVNGMVQVAEGARQEEIDNEEAIEEIKIFLSDEAEEVNEVEEGKAENKGKEN